jgi:D-sedoheptulose 7-phosphate isomerase
MSDFSTAYLQDLKLLLDSIDVADIDRVIGIILDAARNDKQIFILGNGGSAATASHFACDLGKGTVSQFFDSSAPRLRVIALNDSIPVMTAYGNDLAYEHIFSQQLGNLVNAGDVVIGISVSGNSKNVINAIRLANERNATTIGMLGADGGALKALVDHDIHFKDRHFGRVEDAHMVCAHIIAYAIKEIMRGGNQ